MICKLEDLQFLILQGHPKENIVYVADNHVRENIARNRFNVTTIFYSGENKDRQQMLKVMLEFKGKIDIVIFRNRNTNGKDKKTWIRYKKIAYYVAKNEGYIAVTCVPMALSVETRSNNHDVVAFSIGRLEKNSAKGGYIGVIYQKNSRKGIKPRIWKPIDPRSKLEHSILEKVIEPNSFTWFHNSRSETAMHKCNILSYTGIKDTIVRLTGNPNQPFEYASVNHKDVQPNGLYVLASKEHKTNPATCIATTQKNLAHISYTVSHPSWKTFPQAQLMAKYFVLNKIRTFLCDTLGLKHRTYFCFWKAFDVAEIKLPTDYPTSHQLTPKEKRHLDKI
jgi:hypothetical protein